MTGQSTYIFELPDLLISPWFNENGIANVKYTGVALDSANVTVVGTTVTVIFTGNWKPIAGYTVAIGYMSDDVYDTYYTPAAFPANRVMVDGTLNGVVTFVNDIYGTSKVSMSYGFDKTDVTNITIAESNRNIMGHIDATTGCAH